MNSHTVCTDEQLPAMQQKSQILLPDEILTADLADFFKIFGDYTRIRLLFAIKEKELCVQDLSDLLGMQHSAVSHQLKTLRQYKLVKVRRAGKKSFYSLNDHHILEILEIGMQHMQHTHGATTE